MNKRGTDSTSAKDRGTQPSRRDIKEQRGGFQGDQIVGETEKGASNQEAKNRNPQGNKEER